MNTRRRYVLGLLALAAGTACDSNADTTTGRQVSLRTELVADAELDRTFDTETGWSVRLNEAAISLGALYYFDGEPAFVMRDAPSMLERLASLILPSVAYAHPGHYIAGNATGQMTEGRTLALSTEPTDLPEGSGVTGLYRSARVVLAGATSDAVLGKDLVARAEGVATKGDQTVYFKLSSSFGEVSRSVTDGEVDGCVFDETQVTGPGTVTLTVKPHVWFNLVDFSDVPSGTEDAPTEIGDDETPHVAFSLGVVQLSAYRLSFREDN